LHQVVRIAVVGPDKYPEARRLKSSGGWLWESSCGRLRTGE
jgi:hypothetical protein